MKDELFILGWLLGGLKDVSREGGGLCDIVGYYSNQRRLVYAARCRRPVSIGAQNFLLTTEARGMLLSDSK